MKRFFVTGTGTDIGKTAIAAALLRYWHAQGHACLPIKPVISGWDEDAIEQMDTTILACAAGLLPDDSSILNIIAQISPWRFTAALSPHMAAALENTALDLDDIARYCLQYIEDTQPDIAVIEGAGGVMVPLNDTHTICDLMQQLAMPALLVTGSYLGSISHTLTAYHALKQAGVACAAIVVNETAGSTVELEATRETLTHFTGCETITIAYNDGSKDAQARFDAQIKALAIHLQGA